MSGGCGAVGSQAPGCPSVFPSRRTSVARPEPEAAPLMAPDPRRAGGAAERTSVSTSPDHRTRRPVQSERARLTKSRSALPPLTCGFCASCRLVPARCSIRTGGPDDRRSRRHQRDRLAAGRTGGVAAATVAHMKKRQGKDRSAVPPRPLRIPFVRVIAFATAPTLYGATA